MTIEEIEQWITRHAGISQRLAELYDRTEQNEMLIRSAQSKCKTLESKLKLSQNALFQITRLCMKSQDQEKTLETIFSLASNIHKKINSDL